MNFVISLLSTNWNCPAKNTCFLSNIFVLSICQPYLFQFHHKNGSLKNYWSRFVCTQGKKEYYKKWLNFDVAEKNWSKQHKFYICLFIVTWLTSTILCPLNHHSMLNTKYFSQDIWIWNRAQTYEFMPFTILFYFKGKIDQSET